jgi:arylsulfatase A-like enzyme
LVNEGAVFTDWYAQQSCTAGRAAFILGQHPFRTGLLTIGMPGGAQGIKDNQPTIAELVKTTGIYVWAVWEESSWETGMKCYPPITDSMSFLETFTI